MNVTYEWAPGLFDDAGKRSVVQVAVDGLAAKIDGGPTAELVPLGSASWVASFYDPPTGDLRSVQGGTLPAGEIRVYVGSRPMASLGVGGPGGWTATGDSLWRAKVAGRMWGGSLAFASPFPASTDLASVAVHEMGHLLGIGTTPAWRAQVRSGAFHGAQAKAVYGSPVPVDPSGSHWAAGVPGAMDPNTAPGEKSGFTPLDFAALQDIGWSIRPVKTPADVAREFVYSEENLRNFVEELYETILGRPGDSGGVAYWVSQLQSRRRSFEAVITEFLLAARKGDNAAWVRGVLYGRLLGRTPAESEVAGWVNQM